MKQSISFRNFAGRPGRSAALVILTALLSFSAAGGVLIISGLRSGLNSLTARLGADIMVVPYEATTKSKLTDMILQGNPGYFYMNRTATDKLQTLEGIGRYSEQFFLASASSGCCSLPVQIIGFDPETDFTIRPWIEQSFKGELGELDILVGNDLNAFAGDELTFYGTVCKVAAKLEKTGTYLDTAVYADEDTIRTLIRSAKEKGLFDFGDADPDQIVSCALIDVADGYGIEDVLNDINLHVRKVEAVRPQNIVSDVAGKLTGVSGLIGGLIAVVWVIAIVVLSLAFVMIANERKKEFAVMRAMGASSKKLVRIVLGEAGLISVIGGISVALIAVLICVPFAGLMETELQMPFLLPGPAGLILLTLASAAVSAAAGLLSSGISARRISGIDTAFLLRGEN